MPSNTPFDEENIHLKQVLSLVTSERDSLDRVVKNLMKSYEDMVKEASESGSLDDSMEMMGQANSMLKERNYKFKKQFLDRLNYQCSKPYFARIDFVPSFGSNIGSFYIGKHAFVPKDSTYRVSDWRSPIATLYYNYNNPTKDAVYEFLVDNKARPWQMDKKTVKGELKLRRNIELEDGKIIGIYDNNLRIELLTSELQKKSGGQLEDIVRTIQAEQDQIIRTDPEKVCVVQGTAGSGKTTVAIHRLSYLFYTYTDYLTEKNTLLLSSSKVLINYVAKTLPELEIYSLSRDTLSGYLKKILDSYNYTGESRFLTNSHNSYGNIINSKEFKEDIDSYIEDKRKYILSQIEKLPHNEAMQTDLYLKRSVDKPPYELISDMIANFGEYYKELKQEQKERNYTVEDKIDMLDTLLPRLQSLMKDFNPYSEYTLFLKQSNTSAVKNKVEFDPENISVDDISAIYYLALKLRGVVPPKAFKHIIVDEGQDLGVFNYQIIKSLNTGNGFTILGDLNQATENEGQLGSWDHLKEVWNSSEISYFEIKVSYRTTKQIITLARKILEKFKDFTYLPEPFERNGQEPELITVGNRIEMLDLLVKEIKEQRVGGESRSIGIVEFDLDEIKQTSTYLTKNGINHFVVDKNFEDFNKTGVYLVPEKLVKGLEFNTVFVLDPNETVLPPNSPVSAKRLFVACTRAINELYIYNIEKVNALTK